MEVRGKRVLVVGLARSGYAAALALARHGAIVTVSDRQSPAKFRDLLPTLLKEKIGLELGSQAPETFLRHDAIVLSPGVPWDLPQLAGAREKNIPVYPEVEAASWFLEGTIVGITGSNGKTTTTALLGDMLRASGFPTFVGGNIGNALSTAADQTPSGTIFVTELSSFQLEAIQEFRPHVAVMLNLSPNHLDRHPSLEAYAEAKRQIFRNQRAEDIAILNADDAWVVGLGPAVPSQTVMFSRRREVPAGVFVSKGRVYYRVRHLERLLFETRDVLLRGDFNLEDVLAATAAACMLGADFAAIRKAVRDFHGVEHRLEFVREIQGVDFYNNSKATSVDATAKSLEAFDGGVHLIMGGKDKGAPYTPLLPLIKDRVRDIFLIGAAAPVIARELAGSADLIPAGDLATAVYEAFIRARAGDTVLLAPACSSFDQFTDYEERGRVFKELVNLLAEDVAAGSVSRQQPVSRVAHERPPVSPLTIEVKGEELKTVVEERLQEITEIHVAPPSDETQLQTGAIIEGPVGTTREAAEAAAEDDQTPSPVPPRPMKAPEAEQPLPPGEEGSEFKSESELATPEPTAAEPPELRYIYEVEAVELPPAEFDSQVWPGSEPLPPGRKVEPAVDGPLPFEARREEAESSASPVTGKKSVNGNDEFTQEPADPPKKLQTKLPGFD